MCAISTYPVSRYMLVEYIDIYSFFIPTQAKAIFLRTELFTQLKSRIHFYLLVYINAPSVIYRANNISI